MTENNLPHLSLHDKLKALEYSYEMICDKRVYGFCAAIQHYLWEYHKAHLHDSVDVIDTILPELNKYKPSTLYNGYWFTTDESGRLQRLNILESAINDLKYEIGCNSI